MTSHEQNIAIAKLLPSILREGDNAILWVSGFPVLDSEWLYVIHEAEKLLLSTEQQNTYYANIAEITWGCEETGNRRVVFNQLTATYPQRREALLRTLNLWKK